MSTISEVSNSEKWLPVPGYEGLYEVSSLGRVKALKAWGRRKADKVLRPGGPQCIYSLTKGHRRQGFTVKHLVASLFLTNPGGFECVGHKDGDQYNNAASNLYWYTMRKRPVVVVADNPQQHGKNPEDQSISWLPVQGYEGVYEVSDHGDVRSMKRRGRRCTRLLLQARRYGYATVGLKGQDGIQKCHRVHRLVAKAFIPGGSDELVVNHKNGVKDDNRLCNLEWTTPAENSQHAAATGLMSPGRMKKRDTSCLADRIRRASRPADWREIPGYGGRYQVNAECEVRAAPSKKCKTHMIVKQRKNPKGYLVVHLTKPGATYADSVMLHRAVAMAFVPNPEGKPYVHHIDGSRDNARPGNLMWVTPAENTRFAADAGRLKRPSRVQVFCNELKISSAGYADMARGMEKVLGRRVTSQGVRSAAVFGTKYFGYTFTVQEAA